MSNVLTIKMLYQHSQPALVHTEIQALVHTEIQQKPALNTSCMFDKTNGCFKEYMPHLLKLANTSKCNKQMERQMTAKYVSVCFLKILE